VRGDALGESKFAVGGAPVLPPRRREAGASPEAAAAAAAAAEAATTTTTTTTTDNDNDDDDDDDIAISVGAGDVALYEIINYKVCSLRGHIKDHNSERDDPAFGAMGSNFGARAGTVTSNLLWRANASYRRG
jgi:hypothetical protein